MNKRIIFFGMDGGCLDAYFNCREIYQEFEAFYLSDKIIETPKEVSFIGGFAKVKNENLANYNFVYQCGNSKNHKERHFWYNIAKKNKLIPIKCLSKHAYIHHSAKIGDGTIIYPGVKIMRNVKVGENVIILPNTVINHDCIIGDFSIINSGVVLNGNVECGKNNYFGSSVNVREEVKIIDNCTIGMNALILNSINKPGVYINKI